VVDLSRRCGAYHVRCDTWESRKVDVRGIVTRTFAPEEFGIASEVEAVRNKSMCQGGYRLLIGSRFVGRIRVVRLS